MFDSITGSIRNAINKIRHQDDVTSLTKATSELKKALLKADVHHKTTKDVISAVELQTKNAGIGQDSFLKALKTELTKLLTADDVAKKYEGAILLNRLDKETSGVMMFAKNEDFQKKAIKEFQSNRVYKEYVAIVEGKVVEEIEIDKPILTTKDRGMAKSKIDAKRGKPAKSTVYPVLVEGNKSKIKVVIESGRTHQIRVHLNSVGLPIIGDAIYGRVSSNVNRVLLHSKITKIFDYTFEAAEPKEFKVYDFNS